MAAQLSGLTPLLIRTWENRYAVVSPQRSAGNHRLYTDEDVERLKTLSRGVEKGFKIGTLCGMDNREIESLLENRSPSGKGRDYISLCFHALEELNPYLLEEIFESAVIEMGIVETVDRLVLPFMIQLGEGWHKGEWQVYQEHMATEAVRSFLGGKLLSHQKGGDNPVAVVSTPSGQVHDLGALSTALTAAVAGFRVLYLGADTPAEELIKIILRSRADLLLLSIVFPGNPGRVRRDLDLIGRNLPEGCRLILGGSSARSFLPQTDTPLPAGLEELKDLLLELRKEITS